jgi:hypothetical protein
MREVFSEQSGSPSVVKNLPLNYRNNLYEDDPDGG